MGASLSAPQEACSGPCVANPQKYVGFRMVGALFHRFVVGVNSPSLWLQCLAGIVPCVWNPLGRYLLRLKRQVAKRAELLLKVMVSYGRATKMNILLIDDETEICFLVKNLLRREGIGCDVANTMAEGRRQLGIGQYHAVFLDIHLPDGLGYEMIAEIRARQPDVQVIAISAVDNERAKANEQGADLFIPKPFDRSSILGGLRFLGLTA